MTVATLVVSGKSRDIGACARFGASGVPDLLAGAQICHDCIDLLRRAFADDGLEAGQLIEHVGRAAVLTEHLIDCHEGDQRLLKAESATVFGEHDLIETEIAESLHPAKRVLMLFVALLEVLIPGLAFHVLTISLDDEFLVDA